MRSRYAATRGTAASNAFTRLHQPSSSWNRVSCNPMAGVNGRANVSCRSLPRSHPGSPGSLRRVGTDDSHAPRRRRRCAWNWSRYTTSQAAMLLGLVGTREPVTVKTYKGVRGASPTHRAHRRDSRDSGRADGLRRGLGPAAPPDGGSRTRTTSSPGAGARDNRPAATTASASASVGRAGRSPDAVSVPAAHVAAGRRFDAAVGSDGSAILSADAESNARSALRSIRIAVLRAIRERVFDG